MAEIEARDNAWLQLNPQHPGGPLRTPASRRTQPGTTAWRTQLRRPSGWVWIVRRYPTSFTAFAISPDMAVRLESVGWGSAESRL